MKYEIVLNPVKCTAPVKIYENRVMEIFAFPLRHREETYGYLFREKQPKRNIVKEAIGKYDLSLHEIARLKEGEDIDKVHRRRLHISHILHAPLPTVPILRHSRHCPSGLPVWICSIMRLLLPGSMRNLQKKRSIQLLRMPQGVPPLPVQRDWLVRVTFLRGSNRGPYFKRGKSYLIRELSGKRGRNF